MKIYYIGYNTMDVNFNVKVEPGSVVEFAEGTIECDVKVEPGSEDLISEVEPGAEDLVSEVEPGSENLVSEFAEGDSPDVLIKV